MLFECCQNRNLDCLTSVSNFDCESINFDYVCPGQNLANVDGNYNRNITGYKLTELIIKVKSY